MSGSRDEFQRILVVCTRQIGDVLLTTPLISAAQRRWPRARIDVLGFAGTLGMLEGNPEVGELIEVQSGSGWLKSLPLIRRLWRRYDLALITQRSDRAFLYGRVAARRVSTLLMGQWRHDWWKRPFVTHGVVIHDPQAHVVSEKLALLAPWRREEERTDARLSVQPPAGSPLPPQLAAQLREHLIVVHVPSMWRYKQWPLAHFRETVRDLLAQGWQVVLSGSGSAHDRACVEGLADLASAPNLIDAAGRLDFAQLRTLLGRAALYIGPDTSVTHLAAACSVPVIALFGPTPPTVWGPWPQGHAATTPWQERASRQRIGKVVMLQGPGDCVPCRLEGCERRADSRSDCLERLMPDRVLEEARSLLDESRRDVPA